MISALAGDIAAEAAERLGQRAFQDVDAVHDAVALGDAAAARAVHADRMDLVDIGHGAITLGEIADLRQRRDVAVHRIQAFAGDQFRPVGPAARSSSSRCAMSLWRNTCRSQPDCRMPSIIELWLSASDRIRQFGISLPMVAMPVWFET